MQCTWIKTFIPFSERLLSPLWLFLMHRISHCGLGVSRQTKGHLLIVIKNRKSGPYLYITNLLLILGLPVLYLFCFETVRIGMISGVAAMLKRVPDGIFLTLTLHLKLKWL